MKRILFYMGMMVLLLGVTACDDDLDQPPMVVPSAEATPNMTIADFKAQYWQDAVNYIDTVKDDIVIHGYVTANDVSGNIYKAIYISDGTAGLTISINGKSLYETYRVGQELVIPLKDLFVGKYNGQQQLGYPEFYTKGNVWEATFLPLALWQETVQLNGLPRLEMVDTTDVSIADFQGKTDAETLQRYEGKLVRISGVKFDDADGEVPYAEANANSNRNITDADGNTLVVRNSGYSNFHADMLPLGEGDVVGVLSYYATSNNNAGTWQLYLRSADDCIGFSSDTKGLASNPYTVAEAIEAQSTGKSGWVVGYAVGAVAPEVTTVSGNGDVEWKAPTTLDNTLVLADAPDVTDVSKCVIVSLPQNTPFRTQANLKDNEVVYKTKVYVKGTLAPYMGQAGITDNSGSTDEFRLSVVTGGLTELNETFESGLPSSWHNVQVSGDKKWYQTTFNGNGYAAMTGFKGTKPPFECWFITPALDIKNAATKVLTFISQRNSFGTDTKFEVYVLNSLNPSEATVCEKLNPVIAPAPSSGYSSWTESGELDLSQWADGCYYIGFRYLSTDAANSTTWCIDDVQFGIKHEVPSIDDFETMNDGTATSLYGTYTSAAGWTATNCSLLCGAEGSNPNFAFIGNKTGSTSQVAYAPTLNGKTSAAGTLQSPVISGGLTHLSFSYGAAFSDTYLKFRIDLLQNGSVVKTWTIDNNAVTKQTVYTFSEDVALTGDFTILFTNLSPSGANSNKDRVSIWNVDWEPQP